MRDDRLWIGVAWAIPLSLLIWAGIVWALRALLGM